MSYASVCVCTFYCLHAQRGCLTVAYGATCKNCFVRSPTGPTGIARNECTASVAACVRPITYLFWQCYSAADARRRIDSAAADRYLFRRVDNLIASRRQVICVCASACWNIRVVLRFDRERTAIWMFFGCGCVVVWATNNSRIEYPSQNALITNWKLKIFMVL